MCEYLIRVPSSNKKLCGWYFENETDDAGRPYAHFPICGKDACPLAREDGVIPADLLKEPSTYCDLIWKRAEKKEMTVAEVSKALGYEVKIVKG